VFHNRVQERMEENDEVKLISNDPVMLSARKYGGSGGSPS